jgi:putative ABC transport system substrate-binding protein
MNAENVVVVLCSDMDSYKQSADGFKNYIAKNKPAVKVEIINQKTNDSSRLATSILTQKPSVIYAIGSEPMKMLKEKSIDIPVVFSMVLSPQDFSLPNMTGISLDVSAEVRMQIVQKLLPNAKKIGVMYSDNTANIYDEIASYCAKNGLQLIAKKIQGDNEIAAAIGNIGAIDCFVMIPDTKIYFSQSVQLLVLESLKQKFPVLGLSSFYTRGGTFASCECDYKELGGQAGELVVRILSGEKPVSIGLQRPRKVQFSVNGNIAAKLGIKFSSTIEQEASERF